MIKRKASKKKMEKIKAEDKVNTFMKAKQGIKPEDQLELSLDVSTSRLDITLL